MRQESDFIGVKTIPPAAYWGVHTARAVENFPITGHTVAQMPELVRALALVKKACARANVQFGAITASQCDAIGKACDDLIAGKLHTEFVVDVIQGGAGTSTNMNANEVIANLALEHLGLAKGSYDVIHPNDHVNASQSTNDVYPTALKLATWFSAQKLLTALASLRGAFEAKAREFNNVLKIGRTQLQDAVPMTLGQEFTSFVSMIANDEKRLRDSLFLMTELNLGGTAIGTGINAPVGYVDVVIPELAKLSGVPVTKAADMIAATADTGAFVDISGILKRIASKLSKISNDLRLLSSGPQAGVGDIKLPARQAGSSIMPGKVNPVIPEVMNQVCFEVIGNDVAITMAAEAGQLQLNAFESPRGWGFYFVPVQGSAPEPKVMIRLPFALTYFQPSQIGPDDDLIDLGAVRQAVLDTARSLHPGAAIEGGESVFRRVPRQQGVGISRLVGIDRETTTFVSAVTGIGNEVIVHELPEDGSATFVFDE